MATYSVPGQNLKFSVPDDNQVYYDSGDQAKNNLFLRQGNNIYQTDFQSLGGQYLSSLGVGGGLINAGSPEYQKAIQNGISLSGTGSSGVFTINGQTQQQLGRQYLQNTYGIDPNSIGASYNQADVYSAFGNSQRLTDLSLLNRKPTQSGEVITSTPTAGNPNGATVTSSLNGLVNSSPTLANSLTAAGATPDQIAQIQRAYSTNNVNSAGVPNNIASILAMNPSKISNVVDTSSLTSGATGASGQNPLITGTAGSTPTINSSLSSSQNAALNGILSAFGGIGGSSATTGSGTGTGGNTSAGGAFVSSISQNSDLASILNYINQPTNGQKNQSDLVNNLKTAQDSLAGKNAEQLNIQNQLGADTYTKQLQDVNLQIADATSQYQNQFLNAGARGVSSDSVQGEQALLKQQMEVKIGSLSALAAAYQGNIQLAQDRAKQTVDLKYADAEQQVQNIAQLLTANQSVMSEEDKQKGQVVSALLQQYQTGIDQAKTQEAQKYQIAIDAGNQGAPQSVYQSILNAPDIASAFSAASGYLEAPKYSLGYNQIGQPFSFNAKTGAIGSAGGSTPQGTQAPAVQDIYNQLNGITFSSKYEGASAKQNVDSYIARGDLQGAKQAVDSYVYQTLDAATRQKIDDTQKAIGGFTSVLGLLTDASQKVGPYKALAESSKPYADIQQDPKYAQLQDLIGNSQAALRRGFFGTAVTDTEQGTANSFLITNNDSLSALKEKLVGNIAYMQWGNDLQFWSKTRTGAKPDLNNYENAARQQFLGQTNSGTSNGTSGKTSSGRGYTIIGGSAPAPAPSTPSTGLTLGSGFKPVQ